jgi:hypothetical protein
MKPEPTITETELLRSAATGALSRREILKRGWRAGLGLTAVAALALAPRAGRQAEAASSIPPNCIYVCCDGTCDSWKMCLRCVQWPKPPTRIASGS